MLALTRRTLALSTAAIAMPLVARAADTIKIGMISSSTGAAAESGKFARQGAQMALDAVNETGVLGHKLELVHEDDQTTNPGAVLAFSRLSSQPDIGLFVGPTRSTQVHAMAPDIVKAGRPVMFGGTDPTLTQQGNKWLFRCRPNDSYSAKVIAQFGVEELKKEKWAIVHSTDTFGSNGSRALEAALQARGITPTLMQGYTNNATDYTAVILAVKSSGADVLNSYMTFEGDLGIFARQLRQLGVRIPWVGSPTIVNTTAINLAGPALFGTYGVADYAVDATPASKSFGEAYEARFKSKPDNQSAWTFDAVNLLARAMTDAGGTDPEKLRAALVAIHGYQGAEGQYNFDANGDGLRGYNLVRNENGKVVFDRHIEMEG